MRQIASLLWAACFWAAGVQGRSQVLRRPRSNKHSESAAAATEAINRHRALFHNRRRNPYDGDMSRNRIRDRLNSGPDNIRGGRPLATNAMGGRPVTVTIVMGEAMRFRQRMRVMTTDVTYYNEDDFFNYHDDHIDHYDGYRGKSSKSKGSKGRSKSKAGKSKSRASKSRKFKKKYIIIRERQTFEPTKEPTKTPTETPTLSLAPTTSRAPTDMPSVSPTKGPTGTPSVGLPPVPPSNSVSNNFSNEVANNSTTNKTTNNFCLTTGNSNRRRQRMVQQLLSLFLRSPPDYRDTNKRFCLFSKHLLPTVRRLAQGAGRQKGGGGEFVDDIFFVDFTLPPLSKSSKSRSKSKSSSKGMMMSKAKGGPKELSPESRDIPFFNPRVYTGGSTPQGPGSDESPNAAPLFPGSTLFPTFVAGEEGGEPAANGDTPAGDTPAVDTPAGDTPAADTPAADTPAADTPAADTPAADTPAADTPAADTPAADTPAAETPFGLNPIQQTTTQL
ncbi:expressed unknown protein [Seminavis robusta]|uniref:Uncharacterized protein n=1 Tax=Seminavis robusta TaxID=568900 RepID=A0A9N8ES69_9STRA|nr:expressed unknown protein [Seminavis robusta]|eukprot:Sro1726_g293800.1 n/a (502) ;mRNA; r:3081-5146